MADEEDQGATQEATDESLNISDLFNDDAESATEDSTEQGSETSEETESETGETDDTGEEAGGETEEASETEGEPDAEGQEDTSGESEEAEPPSAEESSVPRAALQDERRKRQELEKQVEEFRRKYEADEEAPDPAEDPEGYEQHLRQKWERERWQETANRSRERMLEQHDDYEAKERQFLQMAAADPDLTRQMHESPDPAAFAYEKATEQLTAQEQAVEQRVIARLREEGRLKEPGQKSSEEPEKGKSKADAASKVSDLTSSAGAGNNSEETVRESTDPEDIFEDDLAY